VQVNYLVLERRPRIWLFEILDDEVGLRYSFFSSCLKAFVLDFWHFNVKSYEVLEICKL
jgi:hypothetical protein